MKITLEIENDLFTHALKLYPDKTKKDIVKTGLKKLILTSERQGLAKLFGTQKNLILPRRIRN